jgi:hypothetical protein
VDIDVADLAVTDKQAAKLSMNLITRLGVNVLNEFIEQIALADSDDDTIKAKRVYNGAQRALERLSELLYEESIRDEPDNSKVHID